MGGLNEDYPFYGTHFIPEGPKDLEHEKNLAKRYAKARKIEWFVRLLPRAITSLLMRWYERSWKQRCLNAKTGRSKS